MLLLLKKYARISELTSLRDIMARDLLEMHDAQDPDVKAPRSLRQATAGEGSPNQSIRLVKPQLQQSLPEEPIPEIVKLEKNLSEFGFFSPSSKRAKRAEEKTVQYTKVVDGARVEVKATILAIPRYGLPITADQDKWMAFLVLVEEILKRDGKLTNPVAFKSSDLLRVLGVDRDGGKNYRAVSDWLDVMRGTAIESEGAIQYAGQQTKRTGVRGKQKKLRYGIFSEAVSAGTVFEDGSVADCHYVWLSEWQLNNINNHWVIPIDFKTYRQLKTHVAKALVPLLQINLFATEHLGVYRKRYADLCQILGVRQYRRLSDIKRKLGTALDELTSAGYLARWELERTRDKREYTVVLYHGEKFRKDKQLQEARAAGAAPEEGSEVVLTASQSPRNPPEQPVDPALLAALKTRGIRPKQAREALLVARPDQDVLGQLEYADHVIGQNPAGFSNPPGFYLSLIRENFTPPPTFETSARRDERENHAAASAATRERDSQLRNAYQAYQRNAADTHLAGLPQADYEARVDAKKLELHDAHPKLRVRIGEENFTKLTRQALAGDLARELPLLSFSAFCDQQNEATSST